MSELEHLAAPALQEFIILVHVHDIELTKELRDHVNDLPVEERCRGQVDVDETLDQFLAGRKCLLIHAAKREEGDGKSGFCEKGRKRIVTRRKIWVLRWIIDRILL